METLCVFLYDRIRIGEIIQRNPSYSATLCRAADRSLEGHEITLHAITCFLLLCGDVELFWVWNRRIGTRRINTGIRMSREVTGSLSTILRTGPQTSTTSFGEHQNKWTIQVFGWEFHKGWITSWWKSLTRKIAKAKATSFKSQAKPLIWWPSSPFLGNLNLCFFLDATPGSIVALGAPEEGCRSLRGDDGKTQRKGGGVAMWALGSEATLWRFKLL